MSEHENDPRPVFEGDWQSATGVEKGRHSERVRQWRKRQGLERQRPMAEPSDQPVRHVPSAAAAADLATLDAIILAPKSLASDKIRAVEARQRILARQEAEEREQEHGDLVQLRDALSLIPPHERVAALDGLLRVE